MKIKDIICEDEDNTSIPPNINEVNSIIDRLWDDFPVGWDPHVAKRWAQRHINDGKYPFKSSSVLAHAAQVAAEQNYTPSDTSPANDKKQGDGKYAKGDKKIDPKQQAQRMGTSAVDVAKKAPGALKKAAGMITDPFKRGAAFADKYVTPPKKK